MAVLCDNCGWAGELEDAKKVMVSLGDDFMGSGPSFIPEWHCPDCGDDNLIDGEFCINCEEFVMEGQICDCED